MCVMVNPTNTASIGHNRNMSSSSRPPRHLDRTWSVIRRPYFLQIASTRFTLRCTASPPLPGKSSSSRPHPPSWHTHPPSSPHTPGPSRPVHQSHPRSGPGHRHRCSRDALQQACMWSPGMAACLILARYGWSWCPGDRWTTTVCNGRSCPGGRWTSRSCRIRWSRRSCSIGGYWTSWLFWSPSGNDEAGSIVLLACCKLRWFATADDVSLQQ